MARPYWAGDLSNAEWSHCAAGPLLTAASGLKKKSAGLPSPHVPADILSAGLPAAHRPTEKHNGLKPN